MNNLWIDIKSEIKTFSLDVKQLVRPLYKKQTG